MNNINFSEIIKEFPEGIILADENLNIKFCNNTILKLLNYNDQSLLGKNLRSIDFILENQKIKEDFFNSLRNRQNIKSIYYIKNFNDSSLAYISSKNFQIDNEAYTLLSVSDINSTLYCSINSKKSESGINYLENKIIGKDDKILELFKLIKLASESTSNVLIHGESGTGKELVARAIHEISDRKNMSFVTVNCSALSESLLESELFGHVKGSFTGAYRDKIGKFEISNGGTIFLDEIGDISPLTQLKLLRVVEEKTITRVGDNREIKIDMRIICASNKNLRDMVHKELFREDLFYRLNVFQINTIPLRNRKNDIPILCDYFIDKFNQKTGKSITGFTDDTLMFLMHYNWPGNIRELQNVIEHSFVVCNHEYIDRFDLPQELQLFNFRDYENSLVKDIQSSKNIINKEDPEHKTHNKSRNNLTKERILETLKNNNNNKAAAARELGISRVALWKKLKKINIS